MANNFAEAFFGGQRDAQQSRIQQEQAEQVRLMNTIRIEDAQQQRQTSQQQALYGLAKGYKDYLAQNPQGGAVYYERFLKPSLQGLGFGDAGPYNEQEAVQLADQVLAAYQPTGGRSELAPRVVGDALVDSNGRVLYQAPAQQEYQWSDRAGAWIPKPMAAQAMQGTDAGGTPYRIDPSLTPEQREAALADIRANGGANSYQLPARSQAGLSVIPVAGIGPNEGDESYSQPQTVTGPDGRVRFVQFGNRGSVREVSNYSPPPTDRDAKPPTEGERKAATLLSRLEFSENQLRQAVSESPSAQSPNLAASIAGTLPFIGGVAANAVTPEARQRVEAAQLDILDAALTLGTGAAYTREQLEGYRRSYFPQIGDSQSTINDKAARLQNVISAAKIAAGRAAPGNQERPASQNSGPQPGTIEDGYRFKGGNPADPKNWEPVNG